MKKIVLFFLLLLLIASASYFAFSKVKQLASDVKRETNWYKKKLVKQGIMLNGFKLVEEYPAIIKNPDNTLIFIGHIYPNNEFSAPYKNKVKNNDHPLLYLTDIVNNTPPSRIIFGGDNIHQATDPALEHLLQLKQQLNTNTRFVIGNHDDYWRTLIKKQIFSAIYNQRYWYEDVNKVRLIYLHTVDKKHNYTIDEEQLNFLTKILDPTQYRYALIFQHHALWSGADKYSNENSRVIKAQTLWKNKMIPLIKRGNVQAVFAGDGGNRAEGRIVKVAGIPHYLTGWSRSLPTSSEWLTIKLATNPQVTWHKFFANHHYIKTSKLAL